MTNPYRAMCAELVAAWDALPWEYDWMGNAIGAHGKLCDDSVVVRARALLAQPVERLSDEELDVIERQCWIPTEVCNDAGCEYVLDHRRFAHAVLSRCGYPTPQPPADGEVAKLVEWLQDCADVRNDEGYTSAGHQYLRAAELLKRYALPTPEATHD